MPPFEQAADHSAMLSFIERYYSEGSAPFPRWLFAIYARIGQIPESDRTLECVVLEARIRAGEFDARVLAEYGRKPNPPGFQLADDVEVIAPALRIDTEA